MGPTLNKAGMGVGECCLIPGIAAQQVLYFPDKFPHLHCELPVLSEQGWLNLSLSLTKMQLHHGSELRNS